MAGDSVVAGPRAVFRSIPQKPLRALRNLREISHPVARNCRLGRPGESRYLCGRSRVFRVIRMAGRLAYGTEGYRFDSCRA